MIGGWWVAAAWEQSPVILISWVVWVISSITVHELAHGLAAIRCGDRTPIESGHMTWNPIIHMGPTSLLLFALVGVAFGTMPVNTSRMTGRHADAYVAAAGPLANLLLAVVAAVLCGLILAFPQALPQPLGQNLRIFLYIGTMLNLVLLAFNALPVPPLDGSRIVMSFVPSFQRLLMSRTGQILTLIAFVAVFFLAGSRIFGVAWDVANDAIVMFARLLQGG